jgi:hypothetical protein
MTRKRYDNHSTEFGLWLREQEELKSSLGFVTTNLDFIWSNYKTNKWMLIEEKRYGSVMTQSQLDLYMLLDKKCKDDPNYYGFHCVIFEKTNPDDGRIKLDGKYVDKEQFIKFLKFEFDKPKPLDL